MVLGGDGWLRILRGELDVFLEPAAQAAHSAGESTTVLGSGSASHSGKFRCVIRTTSTQDNTDPPHTPVVAHIHR